MAFLGCDDAASPRESAEARSASANTTHVATAPDSDKRQMRTKSFSAIISALSPTICCHSERTLMKRFVIAISVFVFALACLPHSIATAQESRRFTIEDLLKVRRVG